MNRGRSYRASWRHAVTLRVTGACCTTRTATTVAAFASLAAVTLGSPVSASGQQGLGWPIKEFEVVAVEPAGVVEGDLALYGLVEDLYGLVEEMIRTIRTETNYDPDFPLIWDEPTVSFDGIEETKAEIETVLQEAAVRLESWGFPPPSLEPVVKKAGFDAYRVYLVTGRPHAGRYHPRPCNFGIREAVLVLNADIVLGSDGSLGDRGVQIVVHELVHAAQGSLPSYSCGYGYPGQWATEGTARAIGYDVLRQLRGTASFRGMYPPAWGARMYSERLPVPLGDRGYRTSAFWRFLAEYTHSRTFPDGSATWPVDYSYLPRVLGRDFSPRDCYNDEGAPCDAELRWIDAGLRDYFRLPLRDLYARFMQAYAQYGEERVRSTEGGTPATRRKNWLGASFAHEDGMGCPEVVLGPEADRRQKKYTVARFADVAARCWEVDLEGFEEDVILAVTASYRPGTEALVEQLTAVMADQSGRVDKAEVRTVADVPEATWYYDHLGGADSTIFLLTNVADQPDATRGLANLFVTFTALEEYVKMRLSGGESEGSGDGDGPTPADIAQPTPIDFDVAEGSFSVWYDEGVCLVAIRLESRQADALWIRGRLSPPIAPGSYPIVKGGQLDVVGGQLHSPRYNVGGYSLLARSGFLEIESVSNLMIVGRVRTHLGLGDFGVEVHAEFALRPGSMLGGILGPKASDHPCLTRDDAPGQAAGAGGNQRPGDDGPGDDTENGEDETTGSDTPADSGRPPTDGGAVVDPGGAPDDDPDTAGDREGPAGADGDRPPREDSEGVGEATRATRMIEFLENRGGAVRSHPQPVHGSLDPGGFNVSSDAFDLHLALPVETVAQCSGPDSQLAGLLRLIAMGITEDAPFDKDGSYLISISDAALELDATDRRLRLMLDFEKCGPTRCTPGHLVVRAASGNVTLIPAGGDLIRVDVADAAIEGTVAEYHGACDGLLDFSFNLQTVP